MSEESGPNPYLTPRGFLVYDEFADSYQNTIRVQQSSNAEFDAIWIFTKTEVVAEEASPHLNVEQARRLRDALTAFIDVVEEDENE